MKPEILQIAVPSPLYRSFDYLPPAQGDWPVIGARARVPFGRGRYVVGVVVGYADRSEISPEKLKRVAEIIDESPLLPDSLVTLLTWAAEYYHHPLGEVVHAALPTLLRQGRPARVPGVAVWAITEVGRVVDAAKLTRAPVQRRLLEALQGNPDGHTADLLTLVSPRWSATIKAMMDKGWVCVHEQPSPAPAKQPLQPAPAPMTAQRSAIEAVCAGLGRFHCYLLHGVTGSGKTEVYLQVIERVLAQGRQALVMVPEIALTPQLIQRFQQRFHVPIARLHSGLSDTLRLRGWLEARSGEAAIVLGTRSAVFTPLKNMGLIVVDEEHDPSYKQQEGFRYSARDVAIMRAHRDGIPIVLGSATPSLESLNQVRRGAYRLLELPDRTGAAGFPAVELIDMRRQTPADGLSHPLRAAIAERLEKGEQSLLFLNRRGFAPVWMCHECGWVAPCPRCDARLTYHHKSRMLRCHHCGSEQPLIESCPHCQLGKPQPLGEGTERVETALARLYPKARLERIDRDSTRRKGALEERLRRVERGEADILVGTQMLAKGHDFPNVTLVGVLNADQGLYNADFRSGEQLFQRIMQVSGRAGRADKPGLVLIQTWHPEHPLFAALKHHNFEEFAEYALAERREAEYPPFSHLALLRAESPKSGAAMAFLHTAKTLAPADVGKDAVEVMEPAPAPMERRAGRYRAQLLVQAKERGPLHGFLEQWVLRLTESKQGKKVRWSLDVDPIDLY